MNITISISDELHQGLQELAEKDKRILSKEIEYLLEYCVENKPHWQRFHFVTAEPGRYYDNFFQPVELGRCTQV